MKKYLGIGLLLCITSFASVRTVSAQTFAPLGVFSGGVDRTEWAGNYAAFQTSMGQSATSTDIFIDYTQAIANWPGNANYSASPLQAKAPTFTPIVSVGLTDNAHAYVSGNYSETGAVAMMNAVAAGTYDAQYLGVINAFKSHGFTTIYLRIGWEQDGGYYGWYATRDSTTAAAYVAAWQHIADLAHNLVSGFPVTGITVKTVWGPAVINWVAVGISSTYPGDTYVDIIGPDCYSNVWPEDLHNWETGGTDANTTVWAANPINREHYWDYPNATASNGQSAGGYGMLAAIAFAVAHNKPFGMSECGAGNNGTTTGPSDDGQFPFYLANRLSSAVEQGLTIQFVDVWDVNAGGNWDFSHGARPLEEAAWHQFVATMATAVKVSEPFGVNYAIGTASNAGGSGTGPYSLVGSGTGYVASSTADNFNFIALPLAGDGSFVMPMTAQTIGTGQTGVMLRAGMRPGDPYAAIYVSGTKCTFVSRAASGGTSVQNSQVTALTSPWLKIERAGSTIIGSQSTDGKTWTYVGSQVIPTPANAYIGAAISSGSATNNTATVSNVNLPNDVIVDESAATKSTGWTSTTKGYGNTHVTDNNANKTLPCTVTYAPNLPATGNYDVYSYCYPGATLANNVSLTVNGTTTLTLDETTGHYGYWNYVGTAAMVAGAGNSVVLSNAGTTNTVNADALKFVLNPAPAGAMVGSVAPAAATVNLAAAGVVDWGHWGGTTGVPSTAWDHATLTTPLISNWSAIGSSSTYGTGSSTGYSWTGSAGPNPTATGATRSIYRYAIGAGFQLTVTTGTVPQLLDVYVGQNYVATGQFKVLDSASNVIYTKSIAGTSHMVSDYTISLDPSSTYTVQYTMTAGTGNIDLEAATLTNQP